MNKHQPESGHDIEKLLTAITPQADVHFQEKLERQVLAAYLQKKEGDKVKANGHLVMYANFVPKLGVKNSRQRRWSISLAATLMMVFFVGALIAFVGGLPGPSHEIHYSALQQLTPSSAATPTPNVIGRVPVVVATFRLEKYTQLKVSLLEMQYRQADLMPEDVFYDIEPLIGAVLLEVAAENRPITRSIVAIPPSTEETQPVLVTNVAITFGTPITSHMLTVQFVHPDEAPENLFYESPLRDSLETSIFRPGLQATEDIPSGTILLTSHVSQEGLRFVSDPSAVTLTTRPVVMTTQAIQRGTVITEEILTVVYWSSDIATADMYDNIETIVGQTILTDLRPYSPILTEFFAQEPEDETAREIEAGRVAIAVPIPDDHFFYGFQVGDMVSITASFFYIDADEISVYQITPAPDLPEGIVVPNDVTGTSRLSVQEVIADAKIIDLNTMTAPDDSTMQAMVLAVTSQQAVVLTWLLDAQIPLQYRIVTPVSESD
ncbi:MAG: hypothetical protein BroJett018_38720 [Chloroflexota bacterium]|nr:hypothetical protein [Chloroflexota bacterium]NOG64530.1 hypothetical protein [Chloroflexota bacterium]GIK66078.1 MAG: hypothetical protein BroJett018_38720 [Chloroflexota bacterium]